MTDTENIIQRITANEQAIKSAQHQIDEMKELTNSIHELASEVKFMRNDLNKVQNDIDEIRSKPAKRYDTIVNTVITAITSGLVGFLLSIILR